MKQLTIRYVGADLHQAVKFAAQRQRLSINKYVLLILQEAVGLRVGNLDLTVEFHDLDYLAGTWSEEEQARFDHELAIQREVDEAIWQ